MNIQIAVSKINKYATSESGDTLEVTERPNGGMSVVLADGQTSGRGAKTVSTLVVRKVISLLADGVRDGAAARAASDYLYTERNGKVSATLNILSVDFITNTLVISRNNPAPVYLAHEGKIDCLTGDSTPVGTNRNIRPSITELPLDSGLIVIMYTDGVEHAGERSGQKMDVSTTLEAVLEEETPDPQSIADALLFTAMRLDDNRPADDISVVALKTVTADNDGVRRMTVSFSTNFGD
ncbi:MAG: serine/threonine-protein phosphatase [Anaerolineaceae bacterium]|nr:serine/threonine-protein phosphatase [Anaerolineaceae bacterium]MBN2678555.1 serine/threonine-protein phosphatase [Anaerolineaceae bacterium]